MAKQIKTLKCPQCDSVHITEKRPDFYECKSCGTDFFLDSDDITIHHKHSGQSPILDWEKMKRPLWYLLAFFAVTLVLIPLFSIFLPKTASVVQEKIAQEEVEKWDIEECFPFADAQKQPRVLLIGEKYKESQWQQRRENPQYHYAIFDASTGKQIVSKPLPEIKKINLINGLEFALFDNGTIFAIFNENLLYQFETTSLELKKIEPNSFDIEELNVGFAKIEHQDYYGDCFKIMTNLGKEVYFYPTIRKIYGKDELYATLEKKPSEAEKKMAFDFSSNSSDFPEEKIQLIKYHYWGETGYPYDAPFFRWDKDFGGSGIFTGSSPYRKSLLSDFQRKRSRIIDFSDFTPERYYFAPKVLFFDDTRLLIAYKPTLSPNDHTQLQCLNSQTAEVLWTIALPESLQDIQEAIPISESRFLLKRHTFFAITNNKGAIEKTLDFGNINEENFLSK